MPSNYQHIQPVLNKNLYHDKNTAEDVYQPRAHEQPSTGVPGSYQLDRTSTLEKSVVGFGVGAGYSSSQDKFGEPMAVGKPTGASYGYSQDRCSPPEEVSNYDNSYRSGDYSAVALALQNDPNQTSGMSRSVSTSALKQPDSQPTATKKSVTFNDNIATEYSINRSYGSTSSESSFPQSPEQVGYSYFPGSRDPDLDQPKQPYQIKPALVASDLPLQQPPPSISRGADISYQPPMPAVAQLRYAGRDSGMEPPPTLNPYQYRSEPEPMMPVVRNPAPQQMYPYNQYQPSPGPQYSGQPTSQPASVGYPYRIDADSRPSQLLYPQDSIYSRAEPAAPILPAAAVLATQPYRERTPEYEPPRSETFVAGVTPGVVGAQEVYRDPRDRIAASKAAFRPGQAPTADRMSFREKMTLFASESGSQ